MQPSLIVPLKVAEPSVLVKYIEVLPLTKVIFPLCCVLGSKTIFKDWSDDLIGCPSQCSKYIKYKDQVFEIYLRWRHSDPWTAQLIGPLNPDNIDEWRGCNYEYLNVSYWTHDQLDEIKANAYHLAVEHLIDNSHA